MASPAPKRLKTDENAETAKKGEPKDGNTEDTPAAATTNSYQPIVPKAITTPNKKVSWTVYNDVCLCRVVRDEAPRTKVAALDLDDTLLCGLVQWPHSLHQYELWNAATVTKLQKLYDEENYKIVVFSNKGGIQGAFTGKRAATAKALVDWLEHKAVQRPIHAVYSTKKKSGYHKPAAKLWKVAEQVCNNKVKFAVQDSFYVGDSVGEAGGEEGTDVQFAKNVGDAAGTVLKFYTPQEFFGPSNMTLRSRSSALLPQEKIPDEVLTTRAALMSGYLSGPVLLVLCGAQGSGKSTFCEQLLKRGGDAAASAQQQHWVHLSQDTINKGKPGKREKVEEAATEALLLHKKSVVVDRMHLDATQRAYFVEVARAAGVPVHAVVLTVDHAVAAQRVRQRQNHPVTGEAGAKLAVESTKRLVVPTYEEGFALISATGTPEGAQKLAELYGSILVGSTDECSGVRSAPAAADASFRLATTAASATDPAKPPVELPAIVLGTMGLGRKTAQGIVAQAAQLGFLGFDTAPTYNNEDKVGGGLPRSSACFCIVKVPKRSATGEQVRSELATSLSHLQKDCADLLLLHWPSDETTLKQVWKEMETCIAEGLARAIGVCNFNVEALRMLLSFCSIAPTVNQVERHPLLPQWELMEFCAKHDIVLQAHTPLGQGKNELLGNSIVTKVASETGKSAAQVVLAWNLLQGVAVVPKSSSEEHLRGILLAGNSTAGLLSAQQLQTLNEIGETKRFVAPPFMYGPAPYCWGKTMPKQ